MDVGCDIVEISRVRALARRNKRFLTRVFSDGEIAYCRAKKDPWRHFAVRFAAKEAVWKALDREGLALKDISVDRTERGKPHVLLGGKKAAHIKLSLSHGDDYAMAVALKVR